MYTLRAILLVSVAAKFVSGFGTGFPKASCKSMLPVVFSKRFPPAPIASQTVTSPYTVNARWDKTMQLVRVEVSGATVVGFLIQGRLRDDGPAVGSFVNIAGNPDVKYQDCSEFKFDPESSVTHTNLSEKQDLVFYWKPPTIVDKTESVTFYASLALTEEAFWVKEKSQSLSLGALEEDDPMTSPNDVAKTEIRTENIGARQTTERTTEPTSGGRTTSLTNASLLWVLLVITAKIMSING